jgi:hypothetical protein
MNRFIRLFIRLFKINCPKCKVGKLHQDDVYHSFICTEVNVYSCDKCKTQFV